MILQDIRCLVFQALKTAQDAALLPPIPVDFTVEHPPRFKKESIPLGDYATNVALVLGKSLKGNPLQYAQIIVDCLPAQTLFEKIEILPPGFINFTLRVSFLQEEVERILREDRAYGKADLGKGQRLHLEFVSANPTGPVHVGNGRGAFIGDVLANVLLSAGYAVEKEFYINDFGGQMLKLGRSLSAYYLQLLGEAVEIERREELDQQDRTKAEPGKHLTVSFWSRLKQPSGSWSDWEPLPYGGDYYASVAQRIIARHAAAYKLLPAEERFEQLGAIGGGLILSDIMKTMKHAGVSFDVWFSEKSLHESGEVQKTIDVLLQKGYVECRDDALWFKSSTLGDDKDRVVVNKQGRTTYIASDMAYLRNKFERNFERLLYILGPDHLGYIPRLKAAATALGYEAERITVLVYQQVNIVQAGKTEKIGKRRGNVITLDELMEEVGVDAVRFFYLLRATESPFDFDTDLATKAGEENPVYYVQYAHARICSIFKQIPDFSQKDIMKGDVSLLTHASELELIKKMLEFEEIIEYIAKTMEPHHLTRYVLDLATAFHSFYHQCRVVTDSEAMTAARIKLVFAAKLVFSQVLSLLGVSAPKQM